MIWHALVNPEFSGRLCLTLVHSVWQVALLAFIAWSAERLWRGRSVEWRYALNVAALMACVAAMPITFAVIGMAERSADTATKIPALATLAQSERPSSETSALGIALPLRLRVRRLPHRQTQTVQLRPLRPAILHLPRSPWTADRRGG